MKGEGGGGANGAITWLKAEDECLSNHAHAAFEFALNKVRERKGGEDGGGGGGRGWGERGREGGKEGSRGGLRILCRHLCRHYADTYADTGVVRAKGANWGRERSRRERSSPALGRERSGRERERGRERKRGGGERACMCA